MEIIKKGGVAGTYVRICILSEGCDWYNLCHNCPTCMP